LGYDFTNNATLNTEIKFQIGEISFLKRLRAHEKDVSIKYLQNVKRASLMH
jgi:hypothetical protein